MDNKLWRKFSSKPEMIYGVPRAIAQILPGGCGICLSITARNLSIGQDFHARLERMAA